MFLNEKNIKESLVTKIIGKEIFFLETVDSTNTYARKLVKRGFGEGIVIIADHQTEGRGRFGKKWHSPPGTGAWMSVILNPVGNKNSLININYICALSVVEAIYNLIYVKGEIKWPNDILINKKKVGGILSELVKFEDKKEFIIAGIGININQSYEDFPSDLREIAISLKIISGIELEREKIIINILQLLEKYYLLSFENRTDFIFKEWLKWCTTIGKKIRIATSEKYFEGVAESIKPDGKLLLRNSLNEIKEVTPSDIIQVMEYIN